MLKLTVSANDLFKSLSSVLVAAAAIVVMWTFLTSGRDTGSNSPRIEDVVGLRIEATVLADAHTWGVGDLALIEFSDFECPFCASFAQTTFPQIVRELVETDLVRYVAFNYPIERIHPLAMRAAEASECANRQGRYWEMRELIFGASPNLSDGTLMELADELALDGEAFRQCLLGSETAGRIRTHMAEGERRNVNGTPTFFLGAVAQDGGIELQKRVLGAVSADVLKAALEVQDR